MITSPHRGADSREQPTPLRGAQRRRMFAVTLGATVLFLTGCGSTPVASPEAQPPVIASEAAGPEPIITWSQAPTPTAAETQTSIETRAPTETQAAESLQESPAASTTAAEPAEATPPAGAGTALAQLDTVTIKGRAPKTGYDRDLFGSGWKDPDRNGCDARNDILRRDLTKLTTRPGTQDCIITSGVLAGPFTGNTIGFTRGQGTSTAVQIDHLVALSDAWQKGAQQFSEDQRIEFANDPLNLLAVDGPMNASKGDADAATWLPPRKSYRCTYVARQTAVKAKYGLWMTQAEHDAIHKIITTQCPREPVPTD